jgi:regulatory protein
MKITALKLQAKNPSRVNVYLDGEFAFGLAKIEAVRLRLGQELDEAAIARLKAADEREEAFQRAARLIARRPRSEAEIRQSLEKHNVSEAAIQTTLERLRNAGLVDDQAFAKAWVENRSTFRPRSKRALQAELRRKGVAPDVMGDVLAETNDAESAYQLAAKRAPRLQGLPHLEFRRKLSDYLGRRGYDYDVVGSVVEQVWKEIQDQT